MTSPENLASCPFCGGEPVARSCAGEFWFRCTVCRGDGPMISTKDGAITAWNTRPSPSADDGDVEGAARIIDPDGFKIFDVVVEYQSRPQSDAPWSNEWTEKAWEAKRRTDNARAKAAKILSAAPSRAAPAGDREGLKRIQAEAFLAGYEAANAGPGAFGVVRAYPGFLNGFVCGDDEENAENLSLMLALPAAPQAPVSAPIADGGFE